MYIGIGRYENKHIGRTLVSFFEEPDLAQPLMQSQLKVNSFQIVIELCNLYTADIQFSKSHFKVTSQHHTFAANIHTI